MANPYQKYLIADFKSGQVENKEQWLLPQDAFKVSKNAYIYNGVIYKRGGYTQFGQMVHQETETTTSGNGVLTTLSGTFDNVPIQPGSISFVFSTISGTDTLTDDSGIFSSETTTASGSVDYTTGLYTCILDYAVTSGTVASGTYSYYPIYPVVGLKNYEMNDGTTELLAFNTKRMNRYNTTSLEFDDITGSNVWSGNENSYVHTATFGNKFYITNNVNPIYEWDGTTLSGINTETATASGVALGLSNEINNALLIFYYKSRLVVLNTNETSDGACPQRARWCRINDANNWVETYGGYLDAPTSEWIVSAGVIGSELIVFFDNSIWRLDYTGTDTVFEWTKLVNKYGSSATHSLMDIEGELYVRDETNMIKTDGISEAGNVDDKIPNFLISTSQSYLNYSYSGEYDEYKQRWMTYVGLGGTYSDHILVYNYQDQAWSYYDIPMNCFGNYEEQTLLTYEDMTGTYDSYDWLTYDDRQKQAGFPIILGGGRNGYIYQLNDGNSDLGNSIDMELELKRYNPFTEQGVSARFGYLEIFASVNPNITLTVEFYTDTNSTAYKTVDVALTADFDGQEKVWKRVYANATAWSHSFKITNDSIYRPIIHAFRMAMKPVGGRGGI